MNNAPAPAPTANVIYVPGYGDEIVAVRVIDSGDELVALFDGGPPFGLMAKAITETAEGVVWAVADLSGHLRVVHGKQAAIRALCDNAQR